jgi:ATP-dependent protease HslVU (ClpYQ) peptidase subunit
MVIDDVFRVEDIDPDFTNRSAIFGTWLKLHSVLKDKYFLNAKADDDDPYETNHIEGVIANKYGIFGIYGYRDVTEFEQFWAVGSGAEFALGAMYALYDRLESAEDIAKAGVEAGAEFNNATGLPLTYKTIDLVTD